MSSDKAMITPVPIEDEKVLSEHIEVPELESGHGGRTANTQLDDAARLLAEAGGHVDYTPQDGKRVLRMIDFYVCLPMCLTYFIQQVRAGLLYVSPMGVPADSLQMDKSSVSYAAVFNLQTEAGLVGTQYSWLSSIVYVAQLVCQPLSSYALIVFPVKYWVM